MADVLPTAIFPNYSSDGTNITIPIASLPALNATEANDETGDGREVVRALLQQAFAAIQALPAADRPTKMTISQSNFSGINASTIRQSYTATFDLAVSPTAVNMATE